MPKWWAISCTTVTATSCSTSLAGRAHAQRGAAEDRDPVGERPCCPEAVALGERHAVVHAQQVRVLGRWLVLAQEDDVVHQVEQLGRYGVQGVTHGLLELLLRHEHRPSLPRTRAGDRVGRGLRGRERVAAGSLSGAAGRASGPRQHDGPSRGGGEGPSSMRPRSAGRGGLRLRVRLAGLAVLVRVRRVGVGVRPLVGAAVQLAVPLGGGGRRRQRLVRGTVVVGGRELGRGDGGRRGSRSRSSTPWPAPAPSGRPERRTPLLSTEARSSQRLQRLVLHQAPALVLAERLVHLEELALGGAHDAAGLAAVQHQLAVAALQAQADPLGDPEGRAAGGRRRRAAACW